MIRSPQNLTQVDSVLLVSFVNGTKKSRKDKLTYILDFKGLKNIHEYELHQVIESEHFNYTY